MELFSIFFEIAFAIMTAVSFTFLTTAFIYKKFIK